MTENPEVRTPTVPAQPAASTPLNARQPLLIALFVILMIFVVSSMVNAARKTAPAKSQMTVRPAVANPQQVRTYENQQEQVAKRDLEEQQQRAAAAALMAQLQGGEAPGPESPDAPPMTAAQRAAMYGAGNPNAPQVTSAATEAQAQAKQAALAREKQRQDALNSGTVAVDFSQTSAEPMAASTFGHIAAPPQSNLAQDDHAEKREPEDIDKDRPAQPDAAFANMTSTATATANSTGSLRAASSRALSPTTSTAALPVPSLSCSRRIITRTIISNCCCRRGRG